MKIDKESIMKDQRAWMIKEHLIARGIADKKVLDIMSNLQREKFVPSKYMVDSYGDHPIPIGHNQTISQPYIVALMSELCEFKGDEKVLEIGCGSGYQAAILSKLADKVFSIERIKPLAENAARVLKELGCENVKVMHNDGFNGLIEESPFDVIILTAAPEVIPISLIDQLAEGGRLVAPVGNTVQQLIRLKKNNGSITTETITYVSFVPMVKGYN
ncbi:MAG TPA: protein-L-isoaspartate(D-aspartate) O-methyltransferase [Spirochaetota bacterium]|nr:protein-L-isoaspartate(D-aspartate) O-methyltransferase [Spirochaetota bacterium]HPS85901.1 protein-L-isoaspartate(D-aspartate) O-methyltransferase [Spirochaetota bacterium]